MRQPIVEIKQRPANGCARCVWWRQARYSSWGRCTVHCERTWWQHGPCDEYERDVQIHDDIMTYNDVQ